MSKLLISSVNPTISTQKKNDGENKAAKLAIYDKNFQADKIVLSNQNTKKIENKINNKDLIKASLALAGVATASFSAFVAIKHFKISSVVKNIVNNSFNDNSLSEIFVNKKGFLNPKINAIYQNQTLASSSKEFIQQALSFLEKNNVRSADMYYKKWTVDAAKKVKKTEDILRVSKFLKDMQQTQTPEELSKMSEAFTKDNYFTYMSKLLKSGRKFDDEFLADTSKNFWVQNEEHLDVLLSADKAKLPDEYFAPILKELGSTSVEDLKSQLKTSSAEELLDFVILNEQHEFVQRQNIKHFAKELLEPYLRPKEFIQRRFLDIKEKMDLCEDEKIKDYVNAVVFNPDSKMNKNLKLSKNYFISKDGFKELDKYETLLDAYHCNKNRYSNIDGDAQEFYKYLKATKPQKAAKIEEFVKDKFNLYDKSHFGMYAVNSEVDFHREARLEPLKSFIAKYSETDADLTNHLYKKYYLNDVQFSDLSGINRYMLSDINSKYGTKIFTNPVVQYKYIDRIQNEFALWQQKSGGKAKFPSIIDISESKQNYIDKENPAGGFYRKRDNSIAISLNTAFYKDSETIRHELIHLNDPEFSKTGVVGGIDSDKIIKTKKYAHEFKNAEISTDMIDYAHTDKREFVAVAGTGQMDKYSDEFKQVLVKLGLPEWCLNF